MITIFFEEVVGSDVDFHEEISTFTKMLIQIKLIKIVRLIFQTKSYFHLEQTDKNPQKTLESIDEEIKTDLFLTLH